MDDFLPRYQRVELWRSFAVALVVGNCGRCGADYLDWFVGGEMMNKRVGTDCLNVLGRGKKARRCDGKMVEAHPRLPHALKCTKCNVVVHTNLNQRFSAPLEMSQAETREWNRRCKILAEGAGLRRGFGGRQLPRLRG